MRSFRIFALVIAAVLGIVGVQAQIGPIPGMGPTLFLPHAASGCTTTVITLTSGSGTWNNTTGCTNFKIETVAGGGSGGGASSNGGGLGGGGGGYSAVSTTTLSGGSC